MSDLAAIVKNVASDMVQAGEKAGQAFIRHLKDVGGELKASGAVYRDTEDGIKDSIGKIGRAGERDAARDGGALARDADGAGSSANPLHDGAGAPSGEKPLTSEEQKAVAAREKGADGATDDPVDVVTGEMFLPQEDLALPGVLPLVLSRRHGSAYSHGQLFGTRWASTLDQHAVTGINEIRVALDDGRVLHYPVPGDGEPVMPSHGPRWPLTWDRETDTVTVEQGDRGQTLHFAARETFGPRRPLLAVTDRAGNEIAFEYGADGVISGVRHSGGYHVKVGTRVTLGGTRVTSLALADPSGGEDIRVREFRYSLSGHLTGVVNSSGLPLLFEYDGEERITRWEDRNGFEYRYTYRPDGRVVRGEGTDGFLNVTLDYDLDERTTTVTDALGHATVHHWNDRFQVVRVVDPLGHETRTEKDQYGNVLSVTDELGRTTRIDRDEFSDPVLITRPDGSTVSVTYNEARQPVSAIGPDRTSWTYEYGPHGQVVSATDPAGSVFRHQRDEHGRVTATVDATGGTTRIACNAAGLPVEVTDPLGARTVYRRDAFGHITEVTDPRGAVSAFTWSPDGHPLTRTLPDGRSEAWSWDAEGNLLAHTGTAGEETRFEYGPFDLPVQRTDPDGAFYRFAHTPLLQLAAVTSATGLTWDYEYDAAGNLVAETDFNGTRLAYDFDAAHQLARRANQAGQQIVYRRDALGRITERTSDTDRFSYEYDLAGRLVHASGPETVLSFGRDAAGRVVAETVNGRTLATRFDAAGRVTARVTPTGITSEWTFDAAGRPAMLHSGDNTLEFAHDDAGNETSRSLGPGALLTQSFDVLGRITNQDVWALDQPGSARGQGVPGVGARYALQSRTYAYGSHGLPAEIRDRLRGDRRLSLDRSGRITLVQAATWQETYAFDALGNVTTAQAPAPDSDEGIAGERAFVGTRLRRAGRTHYEFDQAGRLVRKTRRTLSGQTRTWTYTWNADDQLTSVSTPSNGTWRYVYDAIGRRVAKRRTDESSHGSPSASETWFTWDGPRVTEQEQAAPDGSISVQTWDYRPSSFDPLAQTDRILARLSDAREVDRRFFAIVTDVAGTPQELVAPDGEIFRQATTSVWGQVISDADAGPDCPLAFPGQYRDRETGLNYNYQRFYDPETAAYASPDPLGLLGSENPHRYVSNPLGWIDPLGLAAYKKVKVNDAGRFGDLSPGPPGDGLTAHHMPQDALGFAERDEGGAVVMTHEDHKLTRTYGVKGRATMKAEAGLPFKTVLKRDIDDMRNVGQSQHGDPQYFKPGIDKLLQFYKTKGVLTDRDITGLSL